MPSTDHYMTYSGSLTQPGCWESVTWIVPNRPLYLARGDFDIVRTLMQGSKKNPKSGLGPNVRPVQEAFGRSIRTNIAVQDDKCQFQYDRISFKSNVNLHLN